MEETGIFQEAMIGLSTLLLVVIESKEKFVFLCSWIFHHYPAIVYSAQKITCLGIFFPPESYDNGCV